MNTILSKNIKWILFDLSGVVASLNFMKLEGYTMDSRFFSQVELEGFFNTKEYTNYMLGTLSHEQCVGRYIKRNKLDLSIEEFNELLIKDIAPIQGMLPLVEKLSHQYKIALATNEGKVVAKLKIEGSEILPYLSKILASYRLRELKPSIAFFKKSLEIIHAKPEECIFVDDRQENVNAANTIGMKGVLFKDTAQLEKELDDFLKA